MRVYYVIKKSKRVLRPNLFIFFLMLVTFFKSILILTITSLAIHYSQKVFRGFFFHSSSLARLALALASHLPPFDRKTLRNCACSADPGFLNETRWSWFPFLVFLHIKTDGKNRLFLITTSTLR